MASTELAAYLDGAPVGTFTMSAAGNVTFAYASDYPGDEATPLSLSLPLARHTHPSRAALPYLQGLLPDSPERLALLASEFHTSTHVFALLRHVGMDAAGAVQLLPPGIDSSDAATRTGAIRRLTDVEFDALLSDLVRNPSGWGRGDGRWSLAGAQSKVALHRFDDGGWGVPEDSTPTTHILKPAVAFLPDHDVNEFVTMSAARHLGLDTADHELLRTPSGVHVFVSARYDRARPGHRWHRRHQEDLCQALSVQPARKYQADGGPSVAQIGHLFREGIPDLTDRRTAQRSFFGALVFAVATLGTDAHAKNYSVLLTGRRVQFAPLYDLASHAAYPSSRPLLSSMKIGGEYRMEAIGERQLLAAARSLGIGADEAAEQIRRVMSGAPAAFDAAARTVDHPFARRLADAVAAYADRRGWA